MKRILFAVLALVVSITACKKEDESTPTTPKSVHVELQVDRIFDLSAIDVNCTNHFISKVNLSFLFIQSCKRVYLYDASLNAVNWIGFDENSVFGFHDMSNQKSVLDSLPSYFELDIVEATNTHAYVKYTTWEYDQGTLKVGGDTTVALNLATKQIETVPGSDTWQSPVIWVQSNGNVLSPDWDAFTNSGDLFFKYYDNAGKFIKDVTIESVFGYYDWLDVGKDDNVFVMRDPSNQGPTPAVLLKYNASLDKETEFDTKILNSSNPITAMSNYDLLFVFGQSVETPTNTDDKECYVYNEKGELQASYILKDAGFRNYFVFNGMIICDISINDIGVFNIE